MGGIGDPLGILKQPAQSADPLGILGQKKNPSPQGSENGVSSSSDGLNNSLPSQAVDFTSKPDLYSPIMLTKAGREDYQKNQALYHPNKIDAIPGWRKPTAYPSIVAPLKNAPETFVMDETKNQVIKNNEPDNTAYDAANADYEKKHPDTGSWDNALYQGTISLTEAITKPISAVSKIMRDVIGKATDKPNGAQDAREPLFDKHGNLTDYGVSVDAGSIDDPLGKLIIGLDSYGHYTDIEKGEKKLPDTFLGNTTQGLIDVAPDIAITGLFPESKIAEGGNAAVRVLKNAVNNPFTKWLAVKGGLNSYSEAEQHGATPGEAAIEGGKAAIKGMANGAEMSLAGGLGAKVTNSAFKAFIDQGLVNGSGVLTKAGLRATADAAIFAALPIGHAAATSGFNAITGQEDDPDLWDNAMKEAQVGVGMGMGFSLLHAYHDVKNNAQSNIHINEVLGDRQAIAMKNFMAATPEAITEVFHSPVPGGDMNAKAVEYANKAREEKDPDKKQQLAVLAQTFAKSSDVKGTTEAIIHDKQGFIDGIESSDLHPEDKKQLIDKINEVHKNLDPIEQQKTAMGNKITELDQSIANNQDRLTQATDPIEQADAQVVDDKLNREKAKIEKDLKKLIAKQYGKKPEPVNEANPQPLSEEPPANEAGKSESSGTVVDEKTETPVDLFKLGDQDEFYHASPVKREGDLREGEAPQFGKGIYFSTNKDLVIDEFGKELTKVNLSIKKPLYTGTSEEQAVRQKAADNWNKENLTYDDKNEEWVDKNGKSKAKYPLEAADLGEGLPVKYFSDAAKELGYDAIIDKDSKTYDNEIVVLDPKKIIYKDEQPETKVPESPKEPEPATKPIDEVKETVDTEVKGEPKEKGFEPSAAQQAYFDVAKRKYPDLDIETVKAQAVKNAKEERRTEPSLEDFAYAIKQISRPEEIESEMPKNEKKPGDQPKVKATGEEIEIPALKNSPYRLAYAEVNGKHGVFEVNSGKLVSKLYGTKEGLMDNLDKNKDKLTPDAINKATQAPKEEINNAEKAKSIADKIRSLKTNRGQMYGGLHGVATAIYDGALESAASIVEKGGSLADAVKAAIAHIKDRSTIKDDKKIEDAINRDLYAAGLIEPTSKPVPKIGEENINPEKAPSSWFSSVFGRNFSNLAEFEKKRGTNQEALEAVYKAAGATEKGNALLKITGVKIMQAFKNNIEGARVYGDLRKVLLQSNLNGIKQRWYDASTAADNISDADLKLWFKGELKGAGSLETILESLSEHEQFAGIDKNFATAMTNGDLSGAKSILSNSFKKAGNSVADLDWGARSYEETRNDPKVQKAKGIFINEFSKPLEEAHVELGGNMRSYLGEENTYFPTNTLNEEQKITRKWYQPKRSPIQRFTTPHNDFATGLAKQYDYSVKSLEERIIGAVKARSFNGMIDVLQQQGYITKWTKGSSEKLMNIDGSYYEAEKVNINKSNADRKPEFYLIPKGISNELDLLMQSPPKEPSKISKLTQKVFGFVNGMQLSTPLEATAHSANLLSRLASNTPFAFTHDNKILDYAVGKGLGSVPIIKNILQTTHLLGMNPTNERWINIAKEMADVGETPKKYGGSTYSKATAESTGADLKKWYKLQFSPLLYGTKGLDIRARMMMWSIMKDMNPKATPLQVKKMMGTLGDYNKNTQSEIVRALKGGDGAIPFIVSGHSRLYNGFKSFTGANLPLDGLPKGEALKYRVANLVNASVYGYIGTWAAMHFLASGKPFWEDKDAVLGEVPISPAMREWMKTHHLGNIINRNGDEYSFSVGGGFNGAQLGTKMVGMDAFYKTIQADGTGMEGAEQAFLQSFNTLSSPVTSSPIIHNVSNMFGIAPYIISSRNSFGQPSPQLLTTALPAHSGSQIPNNLLNMGLNVNPIVGAAYNKIADQFDLPKFQKDKSSNLIQVIYDQFLPRSMVRHQSAEERRHYLDRDRDAAESAFEKEDNKPKKEKPFSILNK